MQMCMEEVGEWISKAGCQELVYLGEEEREGAFGLGFCECTWTSGGVTELFLCPVLCEEEQHIPCALHC